MKNSILIFVFVVFYISASWSQQISFGGWSNSYLSINSYDGAVSSNAFTFSFSGNGNINFPYWKLSVKLKQPIISGANTFPANKIRFQPSNVQGASGSYFPTMAEIGMPSYVNLQEPQQEIFLVPQSNAALKNTSETNGYYSFKLLYNLIVEGGAYLNKYSSYTQFNIPLQFTAYDQYNNVFGTLETLFTIQINPLSGTPPVTPQFSIKLAANAVNGVLELKTKSDYTDGAHITYPNGLTVYANTDYQVKVTSLQSTFMSTNGNTIPLSSITLSLTPDSGNSASIFPISLSAIPQNIASGGSTQNLPASFSINYGSKPNDVNLFNAQMEQYTTTLQYEITPK